MHHTSLVLAQSDMEKLKKIREGEWNMMYLVGGAIILLLIVWVVLRNRSSKR